MGKQAFDSAREQIWLLDPDELSICGIDTDDGLEHPLVNHRVLKMKVDGFDEAMVRSVMEHGVLEPIVVRKNGDHVEVVIGRNRTLATREANRRLRASGGEPICIRSMLRKDNEGKKLTGAIEAENNVRRGDDPLTKARNALRAIDRGKSRKEVAVDFGVSVEVLDNLLKLPELSEKMQLAVEQGVITATAAATYSDLSHENQEKILDEAAKLGVVLTVPEARRQKKARSDAKKGDGSKTVAIRGKGVAVGVLRKVAEDEEFVASLGEEARNVLRWVIGDVTHRGVTGLAAALRRCGAID